MVTYKQHLFVSLIEEFTLNESFNYPEKVNFLELLLEAPMDDATAEKIVSNKKRVSIYYQGDEKTKKGWYPIDPVRIDDKNKSKFLLAYIVPKDGSKPTLNYFIQRKIVNWNVLGKKDAEQTGNYDKRIMKFFTDPSIPKEKKNVFREKLKNVGIPIKKLLTYAALISSLLGGIKFNSYVENNIQAKAFKEFATLRSKAFTEKDLKDYDKETLKRMVDFYLKNPKKYSDKNGNVSFYEIANDMNTKGQDRLNFGDKKSFGLEQSDIKSRYTKMSLVLGNARVDVSDNGYRVKDIYDFNQYYSNPEQYGVSNFPEESKKIIKYFGNGNYIKGFEEIGNYYESFGYKGFSVNIFIPKA
jgi:hypothetical protein